MVNPVTLYNGSAGLNTVLDPQRLSQGSRDNPGIIEMAQAVNVSIDERGLVTLRQGATLVTAGSFHSLFSVDGGECFAVQEGASDASIVRVNSDLSTSVIRSGLSQGRRMAWAQSGTDTFYSNGVQTGFIRDGVSVAWPVQEYHGPDADMQFATAIPAASHIAFMAGGQVLLAVGNSIFANHAPFQYGLFHPGRGNVANFEGRVTVLAPVQGGFFASDGRRTWFFRKAGDWYQYRQELVDSAPVLEWSLAHDRVKLGEIGFDLPGFGRVWASTQGICIGTDDGQVFNLTKAKVKYPSGYSSGACLIRDYTVIHTAV
jgi:hypothetical protein